MHARKRIWTILESDPEGRDTFSKGVDVFLVGLILLNVAAVIMESIDSISTHYHAAFALFEAVSVFIFSVEYLLRIWSCVERAVAGPDSGAALSRLRFSTSPMALVDLAAILPFFLQILLPGLDLRFIRVLRMVRIFKLTRYSDAMTILLLVLARERKSFGAALFILTLVILIASCGIYVVEHTAQPVAFASIPAAMWWAVATLTTVGYGDVIPITAAGKFFGGIVSIVGIGMVAIPTGILASGFSDLMRQHERQYESELLKAMEDGIVTSKERKALQDLKRRLGLSEETARILRLEALASSHPTDSTCPHCGKPITAPKKSDQDME